MKHSFITPQRLEIANISSEYRPQLRLHKLKNEKILNNYFNLSIDKKEEDQEDRKARGEAMQGSPE